MLGLGAIGQFAIGQADVGSVETITPDKWFAQFSLPVRVKPGLNSAAQQTFTLPPSPTVSFSWFNNLSVPVRIKPINPAAYPPTYLWQPAPSPFVATGWFNWLSEPVRVKPGLRAPLQQFTAQDTRWIPPSGSLIQGWFTWLSEPKRFLKGLAAPYQLAYTAHPRILPTPNVTVNIRTIEINNDQALIAVNVVKSNPPVTATVSIVEVGNGLSPTAVIEN
jgi:hypothetical protein